MLFAGTSGYSFREWVGNFYPPKTPSGKFLVHYASRLNSVEINHTFRRFPNKRLTSGWAAETPESFRFSLKMHQSVTHVARLKGVGDSVRDFLDALAPLGPRLGVVLFQLPPYFRADIERLKGFLSEIPEGPKYALEFRHPSWSEPVVVDLLRDAGVALCAAEAEIGGSDGPVTSRHAYLRLRKVPPYSESEIGLAREQVRRVQRKAETVYVYVKHDDGGEAPGTVLRLLEP